MNTLEHLHAGDSVTPREVSAVVGLASPHRIEEILTRAGVMPVGHRDASRLYAADAVIRHVYRVDPGTWRARQTRPAA